MPDKKPVMVLGKEKKVWVSKEEIIPVRSKKPDEINPKEDITSVDKTTKRMNDFWDWREDWIN